MIPNPFLGVVFRRLGGLASGSFSVPCKGVRKRAWKTSRLPGGSFSEMIAHDVVRVGDLSRRMF